MKKLTFIFAMAGMLFVQPLSAQIKMSSDGKVKIGSNVSSTSTYGLEVGTPSMLFKGGSITFSVGGMDLNISNTMQRPDGFDMTTSDRIQMVGPHQKLIVGTQTKELYSICSKGYFSTTAKGISSVSDRRYKTNIADLAPALDKIMQLRPVRYDYLDGKDGARSTDSARLNQAGLIAQELQEIFPEAVHYMQDEDLYTVEYAALIPFLIKTIQEQQAQIEELQTLVLASEETTASARRQNNHETAANVGASTQDNVVSAAPSATIIENKLWSNTPNPFKQETHIRYALANNVQNAQLCIYNLTGEQIACHRLSERGQNDFTLSANSLRPGIYLYSLIADGQVVDTHRMVVTE